MIDLPSETPSPEGAARREAMLDDLLAVLQRTKRRRQQRRWTLATVGGIALAMVLIRFVFTGGTDPTPIAVDHPSGAGVEKLVELRRAPGCQTMIVGTSTSALDRYRARPGERVVRLDDRTLLATLASIGRPAQLIFDGDRPRLSTPVTDAKLWPN